MKLQTPHPDLPLLRVTVAFANGSKCNLESIGGKWIDVPDDTVEALLCSYNPQGFQVSQAWTKDRGYMSIQVYNELRKADAELEALRNERKERVRREKNTPPAKQTEQPSKD